MDRNRFDALARLVATSASRREALAALLGVGLSGLRDGAAAKKQGKGKRRNKGKGRDRKRDRTQDRTQDRGRTEAGAAALAAACCSTGACTPGPAKNLAKCCYRGQDLSGTAFRGANLGGASFAGATLTGADLRGANLDKTCLVDADLTGARLTGANTGTAVFCRTVMPDGSPNDGGCAKGTACCPTCDAEHACDAGEVCCGGRCRSGDCCTNADCGDPRAPVCANNTCRPCTGDSQCGGRVCCNGICCPSGLRCIDATCQEGCGGDNDCNPGQVCCDQRCRDGDCCVGGDCGARGNACDDFTCRCGAGAGCAGATRSCCGPGDAAVCRGCCDNSNCPGSAPFCDADGACVQCLQNGDCTTSDPCREAVCDNGACQTTAKDDGESCDVRQVEGVCCNGACDLGAQCCGNAQCTNPDRPFCDADGRCVACRNADDCDALPCQTATCPAADQCEYDEQPNGTACNDGGAGVCCGGSCDVGAECCTDAQCPTPAAPVCNADGRCVCPASRVTCNGRCCQQGEVCNSAATPNACCRPAKTTCDVGVNCGDVSDGCGGTISCGICPQRTCQTVACTSNACAYADAPNGETCPIGQETGVCCGGECVVGTCCANADCTDPAAPICRDNVCTACTSDDHCGPNRTCCNGRCGTGGCCTANDQCGEGRVCCDGRCREGTCCTNRDCRVPIARGTHVCRDNVCSPCTAHAECGPDQLCDLRADVPDRLGTCHVCDVIPDPDGLEKTLGEAVAEASNGGAIYICPGEHFVGKFDPTPRIEADHLTLYGAGSGADPAVNTVLNLAFNSQGNTPGIINAAGDTKVMHLSVTQGRGSSGGGFANVGRLTLQDVAISRCHANLGGGISNDGALVLEDVTIADCTAVSGGGGIAMGGRSAVATLQRVAISRCAVTGTGSGGFAHGGGISGVGAAGAELFETTIVGCTAAVAGGGISWEDSGILTLGASTISGCTAVAAGGGIFSLRTPGEPPVPGEPPPPDIALILSDSLVSGCTAEGPGGGIFNGNGGELILRNETVIRNNRSDTEPDGQGVYNRGTITCETRSVPPGSGASINPRVCGNPGNATATLATNCLDTGSSCNNASRPVCRGGAAAGSGACSNLCTTNADCRSGPCCDGFCIDFAECCGDADCTDPDFPTCINNFCAACTVDGQCGAGGVCCGDGVCRECCDMGDCPLSARRCCDGVCKGCCDSLDCPLNRPICTAEEICVACASDGQCVASGRGDVCCSGQCRTGAC